MTLLGFFLVVISGVTDCSASRSAHREIQWSSSIRAVAPDAKHEIEVRANLEAEDNASPVTLHNCSEPGEWPLFTLTRRADLYWSDDGKNILVIDAPDSSTSRLLLFSVDQIEHDGLPHRPDAIDQLVKEALRKQIGQKSSIEFYLPTFVSWAGGELVLAVGGESATAATGPLDRYCMGAVIDTKALRITRLMSETDLRLRFRARCDTSP